MSGEELFDDVKDKHVYRSTLSVFPYMMGTPGFSLRSSSCEMVL